MNWLFVVIGVALTLQIVLFVIGRRIRRREKKNSIIEKYKIDSRQRAWQLLADPNTPEEDRIRIRVLYEGDDEPK